MSDMRSDMREMRADHKALRDKVDQNHAAADAKIDQLSGKVDQNQATTNMKFDLLVSQISELSKTVTKVSAKLNALIWVISGLGSLIALGVTAGNALHWF